LSIYDNDRRLADRVLESLRRREFALPQDAQDRLLAVLPAVKDGAKTIEDLADLSVFALKTRPLALGEKELALLTDPTRLLLANLSRDLADANDWNSPALTERLRAFAAGQGVGLGKIGPGLRAVLSGGSPAPDLAGALSALGKHESLGRLEDALSRLR
jgi:glutamyl-tRNA synthetase